MKTSLEIAKQFKKHKKITKDGLSKQYENTRDCQAFYAGDLMDFWIGAQTTDQFGVKKRAMVQINKVKPFVNGIKGFLAQNRREAKYSARINGNKIQEMYSEYANGLAKFCRSKTYADQKETQQDGDMLINGYGAIETAMSYTNGQSTTDPNGQIIKGRLDPNNVGWDPFAKAPNLLDKRWVFSESIYDLTDALDLFQEAREDDFEGAGDDDLGDGDDGYKFYARGGRYNKIKETSVDWSDEKGEKVKVYFYQWYEFEVFYRCENPLKNIQDPQLLNQYMQHLDMIAQDENKDDLFDFDARAEILTFGPDMKAELQELFGKELEIHEYRRKAYFSAVISKDHVFTKFRNPCQQGFTIKFKTGDYDSKNKIWMGVVNSMKEPTLYYNKALTELMFIIGSNSKGGVYIEEDAVDDHVLFEQQYAKTDAVIKLNPGAIANNKIKDKKSAQAVTGYEQIVQVMDKDIEDVGGVDSSFFGRVDNKQETGVLYARRIKQVIASLACYADSITLYQIEDALLMLDFMRTYAENNDGRLFSIIGQDGKTQFLQITANKLVSEYDVTINEAPQSQEEKAEFVQVLTSIADKLMASDLPTAKAIYATSVKYLPLDYEDRQKLVQLLTPPPGQIDPAKVQQMEQMLQKLMSQASQAQLQELQSKTNLNQAKAQTEQAKLPEIAASTTQKKATAFKDVQGVLLDQKLSNRQNTKDVVIT